MATIEQMTERLLRRTEPGTPQEVDWDQAEGDCMLFTGPLTKDGYVKIGGIDPATGKNRSWRGHRVIYLGLVGDIPDGYQIDHRCKNRNCLNPKHLEAVPADENRDRATELLRIKISERTHCDNGHPFTPDNIYTPPGKTARYCRTCHRERMRRLRGKQ